MVEIRGAQQQNGVMKEGSNSIHYGVMLFLVIMSLVAFWQVQHNDFINLDDNLYITENPSVLSGLTSEGVVWAFTTTRASNWHPVTWLSHMLDVDLFGINPRGHHLMNLAIHITNVLLLFGLLRKMTGALWQSTFAAALFAIHPLHVESVAWAAERKDVLSTFFWMITLWAYLYYIKKPGTGRYLLITLPFALGVMAKPMVVTLPFILLLLDYWPLGRVKFRHKSGEKPSPLKTIAPKSKEIMQKTEWRIVLEKVPLLLLSIASSAITIFAQRKGGALSGLETYPLWDRIANALTSYVAYVWKMFWPSRLAIFYPYPGDNLPFWMVGGAVLVLAGVTYGVVRSHQAHPYLLVGWFWYLATLLPVIGIVQVGWQARADRYTYLPFIGLCVMLAWGIPNLLPIKSVYQKWLVGISSSIMLFALMVTTWVQVGYWRNSVSLFEHTLEVTEKNYLAHMNLGSALVAAGRLQEAEVQFSKVLEIIPNHERTHYNLGVALALQGKTNDAIVHYSEALRLNPNQADTHNNLGAALADLGKVQEAIDHYIQAVRINPNHDKAQFNLGLLLANQGRHEEAIVHYSYAIRIKPDNAYAHNNLGVSFYNLGRVEDAIREYQAALQINPNLLDAKNNLEMAYRVKGNK